jgi:formate hydrogenlyase subunit 3/multisubunit Na+/H+ antiporter MnhD subunit
MVSPIILVAASLAFAFLYPLIERLGRRPAALSGMAVLLAFFAVTVSWVTALLTGAGPAVSDTAGFNAPLSINLVVGLEEALALGVITLLAIAALATLTLRSDSPWHGKQVVLFFVLVLGSYGLVMTRDLFNIFVFLEISGISLIGLLTTSRDGRVFEAGFKYMIASGLASAFFLIGVAFVYRATGSLNIADIAAAAPESLSDTAGILGLLFLLAGILVELKPAPANGWALDIYQAADSGVGALLSGVNATAMVFVLYRTLPIFLGASSAVFTPVLLAAGAAAFLMPQVQALLQESCKRMLGYSSVAQVGLVVIALTVAPGEISVAGVPVAVALVILLNHAVAKAVLFWVAGAVDDDRSGRGDSLPVSLRDRPALLIPAAVAVCALLGLPPFPAFWAKWVLVMHLGGTGAVTLLIVVLGGSLVEVLYLGRWLVLSARSSEDDATVTAARIPADFVPLPHPPGAAGAAGTETVEAAAAAGAAGRRAGSPAATLAAAFGAIALTAAGVAVLSSAAIGMGVYLILGGVAFFALTDLLRVPLRGQVVPAIAVLIGASYLAFPFRFSLQAVFVLIFGIGAAIQLIALLSHRGRRPGLVALTVGMVLSLVALTTAQSPRELFLTWELMTLFSFFLIIRGRVAAAAGMRYLAFSLGSAMLMLAAFSVGGGAVLGMGTPGAVSLEAGNVWGAVLLTLSVLTKLGALGLHIWLPVSYAEAEDEVSSLASSVLSKAGIYLLFLGAGTFAIPLLGTVHLNVLLGWVGIATAIVGAMMALFQEDIKYTLAWSSMSQIGYMVLAFALMSHLGWVTALYLAINHLLFKGMLFLAVAGVVARTGTRLMYQMGGLIKRMPFSFVSVLIAIIALSGVPPLSGFGGKWLLYTALLEEGWYLQAAFALFSSALAFLYLFRLIHVIFLGQRKGHHDALREAPVGVLVPQFIFVIGIMVISMYPNLLIQPLQRVIEPFFTGTIRWEGYTVISSLGYWNGNAVMYVTMGVFIGPLLWLLAVKGRTYRVEQFNIVYAAEHPHTPESTHYGYNFFGHYQKAFGRLLDPWTERFWGSVTASGETLSQTLRSWNTGNPQTYAFQIMLYLLLIYLFAQGGL